MLTLHSRSTLSLLDLCMLWRNVRFSDSSNISCRLPDRFLGGSCHICNMSPPLCLLNQICLGFLNVLGIEIFLVLVVGNLLGLHVVHRGHEIGLVHDLTGRTTLPLLTVVSELAMLRSCLLTMYAMHQAFVKFWLPFLLPCKWPWPCPASSPSAAGVFS